MDCPVRKRFFRLPGGNRDPAILVHAGNAAGSPSKVRAPVCHQPRPARKPNTIAWNEKPQ